MSDMLPKPYFALVDTSRGGDPAIVVVNTAVRGLPYRDSFPWHLIIRVACKFITHNGMPTIEELPALDKFESIVSKALLHAENAAFFARVTCRGERELIYRVRNPGAADEILKSIIDGQANEREWDYHIENDPDWELVEPELALVDFTNATH
jgi:hypothetical protein